MRLKANRNLPYEPVEMRRDWLRFYCFAHMAVRDSGGPAHRPYEPILQLFITSTSHACESWTIYRHGRGWHKKGKIVFKQIDTLQHVSLLDETRS